MLHWNICSLGNRWPIVFARYRPRPNKLVSSGALGLNSQSQIFGASSDLVAWVGQMRWLGGSTEDGPAQSAPEAIWKSGTGFQGLTMRWRKVLSPLGLPVLAVICTTAKSRSVRGAVVSLQAVVLRFLQKLPFVSFFIMYPPPPPLLFLTASSSFFVSKSLSLWLPD